jgi:hypothetical protein
VELSCLEVALWEYERGSFDAFIRMLVHLLRYATTHEFDMALQGEDGLEWFTTSVVRVICSTWSEMSYSAQDHSFYTYLNDLSDVFERHIDKLDREGGLVLEFTVRQQTSETEENNKFAVVKFDIPEYNFVGPLMLLPRFLVDGVIEGDFNPFLRGGCGTDDEVLSSHEVLSSNEYNTSYCSTMTIVRGDLTVAITAHAYTHFEWCEVKVTLGETTVSFERGNPITTTQNIEYLD